MIPAGPDPDKLTICHANADGSWSEITVDENALNGHQNHGDDIWPPYEGITEGSNWPEGEDIFLNGCMDLPETGGFDSLALIAGLAALLIGALMTAVARR